jgi:hypothetical protein
MLTINEQLAQFYNNDEVKELQVVPLVREINNHFVDYLKENIELVQHIRAVSINHRAYYINLKLVLQNMISYAFTSFFNTCLFVGRGNIRIIHPFVAVWLRYNDSISPITEEIKIHLFTDYNNTKELDYFKAFTLMIYDLNDLNLCTTTCIDDIDLVIIKPTNFDRKLKIVNNLKRLMGNFENEVLAPKSSYFANHLDVYTTTTKQYLEYLNNIRGGEIGVIKKPPVTRAKKVE